MASLAEWSFGEAQGIFDKKNGLHRPIWPISGWPALKQVD
jgi:hypothetical protein